ncbi:MAG TPA: hypothetical protein VMV84_03175 [Dehalococcoidales bacterium]|nr:hypothetical protein [Dehalococcoidales bacterium]
MKKKKPQPPIEGIFESAKDLHHSSELIFKSAQRLKVAENIEKTTLVGVFEKREARLHIRRSLSHLWLAIILNWKVFCKKL